MEFKLTGKSVSQSILDQYKVEWKLHAQRLKRTIRIFCILTVLFLIAGIFSIRSYSMIQLVDTTIYFNLNFFLSLAFSFLLVTVYFVFLFLTNKKVYIKSGQTLASMVDSSAEAKITLENDFLEISNSLYSSKIQWKLFSGAIFLDDFILLTIVTKSTPSLAIDTQMISPEVLEDLKKVLAEKIQ